jgi:hypothetical protein
LRVFRSYFCGIRVAVFENKSPAVAAGLLLVLGLQQLPRATRNFDSGVAIVEGRQGFGAIGAA